MKCVAHLSKANLFAGAKTSDDLVLIGTTELIEHGFDGSIRNDTSPQHVSEVKLGKIRFRIKVLLPETNRIMEIAVLKTVQRIVMYEDFDWSLGWEQMGGIADPLPN